MNVIEIIERLTEVTTEAKTEYLRHKLLDYYKTVNRGVVSIPPLYSCKSGYRTNQED